MSKNEFNKIGYSQDIINRFWSKVNYPGNDHDCWEWTAGLFESGYGQFGISSKIKFTAHKFSFEYYHGKIPKGLIICHTCDNKICVNPNHLFLGTCSDNSKDMVNKGRSNRGEDVHTATIKEQHVIEMLDKIISGEFKNTSEISKYYGIETRYIRNIIIGLTWKHISSQYDIKYLQQKIIRKNKIN